jgi:hypothetical protein
VQFHRTVSYVTNVSLAPTERVRVSQHRLGGAGRGGEDETEYRYEITESSVNSLVK